MNTQLLRKYFATLLFSLSCFAIAPLAFAATEIEYQQEYKTNPVDDAVFVREKPSSNSTIIALIYKNDTVTVWASNGIYKKVTINSGNGIGRRGYVESSDLRSQGYPDKPSTNNSQGFKNTTDYLAVVTAKALRVRSGPGENYQIYDRRLVLDETVKVTHTKKGSSWVRIEYSGKSRAYVSQNFLRRKLSTDSALDNSYGFRNTTDYLAVVTANKLRVRSGPGENHRIYDRRLVLDETVKVTHTKIGTDWVRIEYRDNLPAFVSGEFLRRKGPTDSGTTTDLAQNSSSVTFSNLKREFLQEVNNASPDTYADQNLIAKCQSIAREKYLTDPAVDAFKGQGSIYTPPEPVLDTSSGSNCLVSLLKHAQTHKWAVDLTIELGEALGLMADGSEDLLNHPVPQLLGVTDVYYCVVEQQASTCVVAAAGLIPVPISKSAKLAKLLKSRIVPKRIAKANLAANSVAGIVFKVDSNQLGKKLGKHVCD